jgi:hypothetical protein
MDNNFDKVKSFILELGYSIEKEDKNENVFVIDNEEEGVKNMIVAIAEPIVIFQQHLFNLKKDDANIFKALLQKNQDIIHGAFIIDSTGTKVLFRDTLQLENLDMNEVAGTLNSLSLLMAEYGRKIVEFSA